MLRRFKQIDVFPGAPLGGNPLAVVLDGDDLGAEEMHAFARWTNLSETTFVVPPTDVRADYRVRIFTPGGEIPFAGHPTLGTCHAWLESRDADAGASVVQECGVGLVRLRQTDRGLAFAAPPRRRSGPLGAALTQRIAECLRIDASEILAGEWADNGAGWAAVLLRDADAVLTLTPSVVDLDVGVIGPYRDNGPADFEVRAFYPKNGATAEDPVTGSLNAAVAEWLIADGRAEAPYDVRQGTAIGHDGRLSVELDDEGVVWVAGSARTVVEGNVSL